MKQAIALNPDYTDAYDSLARIYDDQGKLAEALENYQKFVDLLGPYGSSAAQKRIEEIKAILKTATPTPSS